MSKYGVFSGPNTGKYGPEKTPYLDNVHAVHDEKNVVVNYRYIKEHTKDIKWILILEKTLIWLILLSVALTNYIGCLKFSKRFKVFLRLEFSSEPDRLSMEK